MPYCHSKLKRFVMDRSAPLSQAAEGPVTSAAQIAYATPTYQPTAAVAAGAPAMLEANLSSTQSAPSFPASPRHLSSQHQLAFQKVQQFHHQQQQHEQQQLQAFWSNQILEIEQTTDFKNHSLPLARIKKIMKADEDVRMISAEAPVVFAKACEIFILELTLRSWINTEENKRRTLQKNDIAAAISRTDKFDFLVDIVPRDELKEVGIGLPRAALPAIGAPTDAIPYCYQGMIVGKLVDQNTVPALYSQPPHPMAYVPWPQPQMQSSQQPQPPPPQQQTNI